MTYTFDAPMIRTIIATLPPRFHSNDVAEDPGMVIHHEPPSHRTDISGFITYLQQVGRYLSRHRDALGIVCTGRESRGRGAQWERRITAPTPRTEASLQP